MEIEGHPTRDMLEELERRGAIRVDGSSTGPRLDTLRFIAEKTGDVPGLWVFLPREAFLTGMDEPLA